MMTAILMFVAVMTLKRQWGDEQWGDFLQQKEYTIRINGFPEGGTITRVTSSNAQVVTAACVGVRGRGEPVIRFDLCKSGTTMLEFRIRWKKQEYVFRCCLRAKKEEWKAGKFQFALGKWEGESPPNAAKASQQVRIQVRIF